jgi:hypothetical protein
LTLEQNNNKKITHMKYINPEEQTMSKKRVAYSNLLKEAISEFDTSKTVDVKGPMLDPILKWDGGGEVPTHKDAASILERYYFNEKADKGVEVDVSEMEYNEDGTEKKTSSEKHTQGAGTEQAGTSDKAISGEKEEIKKDLAKEAEEKEMKDEEEAVEESETVSEADEKEMDDEEEAVEESEDLTEDIENAVIEKLIAEMEEDDSEEVSEMEMTYKGEGPKEEAPKEKKAKTAMDDTKGAGTEQAGTGTAAGQVPDRKDQADKMVKPKNYNEQDEMKDKDVEDEEELDVDKEVKEAASAVPGGPSPKKTGEDYEDDVYEEAFKLFTESIEEENDKE